jgi:hypothetical protein
VVEDGSGVGVVVVGSIIIGMIIRPQNRWRMQSSQSWRRKDMRTRWRGAPPMTIANRYQRRSTHYKSIVEIVHTRR